MKNFRLYITIILVFTLSIGMFKTDFLAGYSKFKLKDITVTTTTSSIKVDWKDKVADNYLVYLDDKKYKRISEPNITISNLQPDYPYELEIKAINGKKIEDTFVVQTLTRKEISKTDDPDKLLDNSLTTAIFNAEDAKIIFENVPDDDKDYKLQRNGEIIGNLKGNKNFFVDSDLKPETTYNYTLIGGVKLSKAEKKRTKIEMKDKGFSSKDINVEAIEHEYMHTRTIKTLKKIAPNEVNAESFDDPYPGAEFVYTTFIPMKVFTFTPPGVEKYTNYHKFEGDGRGFDKYAISDKFRTRTRLRVSFPPSGGSKVRFDKDYNYTSGQNKNTGQWVTSNADMSKVYLEGKNEYSTHATFTVRHAAANGLHNVKTPVGITIPAPEIDYNYSGIVYKSGYFEISGSKDNAPAHELSFTPVPGEVHGGTTIDSSMQSLLQNDLGPYGFYHLINPMLPQGKFRVDGYWK